MKNDKQILRLRGAIGVKEEALKASNKRFDPITNCSLVLDQIRYNLHVLREDDLTHLLIKLNSLIESARQLDLLDNYTLSGFMVSDWAFDIKSKLQKISHNTEMNALRRMKNRLTQLLSEEKQTELEIVEIESFLENI